MKKLAILHFSVALQEAMLLIIQFILLDKITNENISKSDETEKTLSFFTRLSWQIEMKEQRTTNIERISRTCK